MSITLHEAIVQVLTARGASNSKAIAAAINEQKLYTRKDGKPVPTSQISARISKYPELFTTEFGGNYQLKTRKGSGSEDYANLFHQIGDVFYRTRHIKSPLQFANFTLWLSHLLSIRNILDRHSKAEERSNNEYLSNASALLDVSSPHEAMNALRYFVAQPMGNKMPKSAAALFQTMLTELDVQAMSNISSILRQFNFDYENSSKIIAAARAFLARNYNPKQGVAPVSEYLHQLIATLYKYEGERQTELNLFSGTTPLVPANPAGSKRKTYLQTHLADEALFLSLCKALYGNYEKVFHAFPFELLTDETNRFQAIFAMLPFGSQIPDAMLQSYPGFAHYGSKSELIYIDVITQLLAPKGIAFVVVPIGLLVSNAGREVSLRSKLLETDSIEAVLALPKVLLPHASVNLALLILNNAKDDDDKGKVHFIDTTAGFTDKHTNIGIHPDDVLELLSNKPQGVSFKTVSVTKLIESDCNLLPSQYISPVEIELNDLAMRGIKVAPLSQLLTEVKFPTASNNDHLPFIKIANLRNSETEFQLTEVDLLAIQPSAQRGSIVIGPLLLTAKVGENLKPTILTASQSQVCLSTNIAAFRIDETKVLPDFLISEFFSTFFKKQFAAILGGSAQPNWKSQDLLQLLVRIPSIEQQQQALREKLEVLHRLKQSEADKLKEKLHYKETEYSIISSVRHSLASQFGGFRTDIDSLKAILSAVIEKSEQISWQTRLSPQTNLADIFTRIDAKVLDAQLTFDKIKALIELNRRELNFERTDMGTFLAQCIQEMNLNPTEVKLTFMFGPEKNTPVMAEVDRFLLKELLRNLIENSLRHGKKDNEPLQIIVLVDGNPNEQKTFTLQYRDFGKGLPEGFSYQDYLSFGKRSGLNQGTGIGGYMVKQITDLHSGTVQPIAKTDIEICSFGLSFSLPFTQTIE